MMQIDMHVHSTFSDGTFTPERLAALAKKSGISLLALTDHDTTAGLASFMSACAKEGVRGLRGVEMSAKSQHTLHILGYRIAPGAGRLESRMEDIRKMRDARNSAIFEKLRSLGVDVYISEAEELCGGEVLARPHIARLLVLKGYAADISDAFRKYLDKGGAAYVARERLSAEECISLIDGAGGVAVLAHPSQCMLNDSELESLLKRLKDAGLWGVEAVYGRDSPEQTYKYLKMAGRFGLYTTAGSDFHGLDGHRRSIGMFVRDDFLPWARLGVR